MVEVQKLRTFPISAARALPSAEIVRVEALSLWRRANLSWSRRTLCGDCACRSALAVAPCNILAREAAFGSCLVVCAPAFAIPRSRVRLPPGPRQLRLENRSISQLLSTNVVRGECSCSSGWKIVTFKYRRSVRSVLPQLRLENRNFEVQT